MTQGADSFEIAEAGEADLAGCQALWRRCGLPADPPTHEGALCGLLVARDGGGAVVGCVALRLEGNTGWLLRLAVEPELRGLGLARRLMRSGEAWLGERGAGEAQVLLGPADADARRASHAFGYAKAPVTLLSRHLRPVPAGDAASEAGVRAQPAEPGKLVNTITYLEMRSRPRLPTLHPPAGAHTALLRCLNPTIAFYRFLYNTVGEPWLWWERRLLDDETLAATIQDPKVEIYVLYLDGQPAGYAELNRRQEPEVELAYFGLMPAFIGRRLGPYLLASAIDIAWSYEPSRLHLNTNTLDHPKALSLYQRMGFVPYRQEQKVIDDPRVTGVIPGGFTPG